MIDGLPLVITFATTEGVMTQTPTEGYWLLRFWGRDGHLIAERHSLTPNDGVDNHAYAVWFASNEAREAFCHDIIARKEHVMLDRAERDGESIHGLDDPARGHLRTYTDIVLRTPDGREYAFTECFGYGYPGGSAEYMWREGNYSCDCNKRLHIARHGGPPEPEDNECGDTIELVSLRVRCE